MAQTFAGWVRASKQFELAVEPALNLVCFRHRAGDELNQALLDRLNQSGKLYLTHTRLNGQLALRLSVGQTHTGYPHVERAWQRIQETAAAISIETGEIV